MPLVSQTYAGQFLTASELVPLGQHRTAVVHACAAETIGQDNKTVLVLDLVSPRGLPWPKRCVLNKSNSIQLAAAFGDDTDGWIGKQIEIWAENVMFQGRVVPGLKMLPAALRPASSNGAAATPHAATPAAAALAASPGAAPPWTVPSDLDDEIPF